MNENFHPILALAALLLIGTQVQATASETDAEAGRTPLVRPSAPNTVPTRMGTSPKPASKPKRAGSSAIGGTIGARANDGDEAAAEASADRRMWSWHGATRAAEPAAARARSHSPLTFRKRIDAEAPLIDASIRKIDRGGLGGATRLWLRNGGTQRANNCQLAVRGKDYPDWIVVESASMPAGQTIEIKAPMPRGPALEFAVTCPGESQALLADNIVALP
ncbi:MAG TPA: hypothetical protein VFS58_06495 [Steroidobacteraceae bacterium]|nr:hypothetical protein [Steroidobacteraceae bacterium]